MNNKSLNIIYITKMLDNLTGQNMRFLYFLTGDWLLF